MGAPNPEQRQDDWWEQEMARAREAAKRTESRDPEEIQGALFGRLVIDKRSGKHVSNAILKRRANDLARRGREHAAKRRPIPDDALAPDDQSLAQKEDREECRAILDSLPDEPRHLLELRWGIGNSDGEGMTADTLASRYGVTPQTINARLRVACLEFERVEQRRRAQRFPG